MFQIIEPSGHIRDIKVDINNADRIRMSWRWQVEHGSSRLYAAHQFELKHDRGVFGGLFRGEGGYKDKVWVAGETEKGITYDFSQEMVNNPSPSVKSTFEPTNPQVINYGDSITMWGQLDIPGPLASPVMADFWDDYDGAKFHLTVKLFQVRSGIGDIQRSGYLGGGVMPLFGIETGMFGTGSKLLGEHRFDFLWEADIN